MRQVLQKTYQDFEVSSTPSYLQFWFEVKENLKPDTEDLRSYEANMKGGMILICDFENSNDLFLQK